MLFSSRKLLAIDIGSSSIKMAELEVGRKEAKLLSFVIAPTPPSSVSGGDITNSAALSQAIRLLTEQIKTKRKQACTGLWGTAVIVKKISMPRIDPKMVAQQITWEAEQYIPFDINEITLEHSIIKSTGSSDSMDILLVGAQNALVEQYRKTITDSGLTLSVLDVSAFAFANLFEWNYGRAANQTIALLNIGAGVSNFVVLYNGEVVFARDIPVGGLNYTFEIHKEMGVTLAEAESLKLSASGLKEVPEEVHGIIRNTNQTVVEEIRNSFDFFQASNTSAAISQCYFTGGASPTPQLVQKLSEAVGVGFQPINPFIRVKPHSSLGKNYLSQINSISSVVMGLGLRKAKDS